MKRVVSLLLLVLFLAGSSLAGDVLGWVEIVKDGYSIFVEASGPAYRDIEEIEELLEGSIERIFSIMGDREPLHHFDVFIHSKMGIYVGPGGGYTTTAYGRPQMHIYYQEGYDLEDQEFLEVTENELTKTIFYTVMGKPDEEINNSNTFSWMMEGLGASLQGETFDGLSCELWSLLALDNGLLFDISRINLVEYGEYLGTSLPGIIDEGIFLTFHERMFYLDEVLLPQMGSFCNFLCQTYGIDAVVNFIASTADYNFSENAESYFGYCAEELQMEWLAWLGEQRDDLVSLLDDYTTFNELYSRWVDVGFKACNMGVKTLQDEGDGVKLALVNECISRMRLTIKDVIVEGELDEAQDYITDIEEFLNKLEGLGSR